MGGTPTRFMSFTSRSSTGSQRKNSEKAPVEALLPAPPSEPGGRSDPFCDSPSWYLRVDPHGRHLSLKLVMPPSLP